MPIRGLVSWGALSLFAMDTAGRLGRIQQTAPNGEWSSWESWPIPIGSAPAAAQNLDGRLEVFAAGEDGRLGHIWQQSLGLHASWSQWVSLDVEITGDPAVFQSADGRLMVFAAGPRGNIGYTAQLLEGGMSGWTSWRDMGPKIQFVPSVFRDAEGRLEVFALDGDGRLGCVRQRPAEKGLGWSTWATIGPQLSSAPVAFQNVDGRLEVFGVDLEGHLGHTWQPAPGDGRWSRWDSFTHSLSSPPAVFQNADGRLEVFAAGPGGRLGHLWQHIAGGTTGWSDWHSLEHVISGTPSVFPEADGRLEVFALDVGGRLGHMSQLDRGATLGWSEWTELDAPVTDRPVTVCQTGAKLYADLGRLAEVQLRADSRWPQADPTTLRADVCVIGAGPAGITLSRQLIDAGATVLLLESGGWGENDAAQELNHGDAYGPIVKHHLRYLRHGRSRHVQGSAIWWERGWCMPFRALDYEARPWVEHSGWPLRAEDLAPYEERAAATLGFEPFGAPQSDGALVRLSYRFPDDPQVFRRMFLELLTRPGFQVELGATALALARKGDRVESVRAGRIAGGELQIRADKFVIAAGGIENARLLLLNASALGLPSPMVGRFFMEHPHVLAGRVQVPDTEYLRPYMVRGSQLDVLSLADAAQQEERLLNASVQLRPLPATDGAATEGARECDVYIRAEQAPNPDSRLALGEQTDRFGCPSPVLHWELLEHDWASVVRTAELVAFVLERQQAAQTTFLISADAPWPWAPVGPGESTYATWGNHHMGTTRMARDPAEGVVDPDCLVHGTTNLFAAGSSVFPTGGCANPTFQIVVLAHRLADRLMTGG